MKWGTSEKYEKLRETSRLHQLWATYVIVSPDSITKSEYAELKQSHLPLNSSMCLPWKAYLLGKAEAQVRPSLRKSLEVNFSEDTLTRDDYTVLREHEERLTSLVKSAIAAELEGHPDLLNAPKADLRSLVVKCLDELKVIKNSAYINSIVNKEGIYEKSLGMGSSVVSTGNIHSVVRVGELPSRNVDDLIFLPENMAKAIGDSALSPTVKPAGPASAAKTDVAKVGSMSGAAAPTQTAGPGKPPGAGGVDGGMTSCPYGGGDSCIQAGGNGAKNHKEDGVIMKRHAEAMQGGDAPPSEEGEKELVQQEIRDSTVYNDSSHPHSKTLKDLRTGDITNVQSIGSGQTEQSGINEAFKASIIGGGTALMKPDAILPEEVAEGIAVTEGAGTVPLGRNVGREVATYGAAVLHGDMDLVPPTTSRNHDGKPTSMQQWKDGHTSGYAAVGQVSGGASNYTKAFLDQVPESHKEKVKRKINKLIVNTIITNDNDKHFDNIVINEDFTDFSSIDGGMGFGNSMSGYKNTMQYDMHNAGMKMTVDQETQTRLSNMSLRDYTQGLGGNVEDWSVGQTFLRNRYTLFLQETEGEIDYEKFRTTLGTLDNPDAMANPKMWKNLPQDEFLYRKENGLLPGQLFDSWSKGFLDKAAGDPSHSDHEDAKKLQELGVFMGPGFAQNPEKYRREGKHLEYAKTIKGNMDLPKTIRRDSRKPSGKMGDNEDASFDAYAPTVVAGSDEVKTAAGAVKTAKPRRKRNG